MISQISEGEVMWVSSNNVARQLSELDETKTLGHFTLLL